MDDVEIGARVRAAREAAGWSLVRLAEVLGIDGPLMGRTERGQRMLKARELVAVARTFGMSIDELLGGTSTETATAARRARALTEPVSDTLTDWLAAVGHAVELGQAEAEHTFDAAELDLALAFGDAEPLPVPRTVVIPPGAMAAARYVLDELPNRFTIKPYRADTDTD